LKKIKGGVPDIQSAARAILNDWNSGRIPFYTLPPAVRTSTHISADIVSEWSKEFDLSGVTAEEEKSLEKVKKKGDMSGRMLMIQGGIGHNIPMKNENDTSKNDDEEYVD